MRLCVWTLSSWSAVFSSPTYRYARSDPGGSHGLPLLWCIFTGQGVIHTFQLSFDTSKVRPRGSCAASPFPIASGAEPQFFFWNLYLICNSLRQSAHRFYAFKRTNSFMANFLYFLKSSENWVRNSISVKTILLLIFVSVSPLQVCATHTFTGGHHPGVDQPLSNRPLRTQRFDSSSICIYLFFSIWAQLLGWCEGVPHR